VRKLPKPQQNPKEYFELCISKSEPQEKKRRLENSANAVEESCTDYEAKAESDELYKFKRIAKFNASDEELYKVYDSGTRVDGPGRKYYDHLLLSSSGKVCTLCWRREADTIDHYLPRSVYQELSVAPANLIPACGICNGQSRKGTHVPSSYKDQLIHPYFDDYTEARWLFGVTSEVNGKTTLKFKIIIPDDWDPAELERLGFHFDKLGLWGLYVANAASEMENIADMIGSACIQGTHNIKAFLLEMAGKKNAKNPNSWETASYYALADHNPFLEEMAEMTSSESLS